MKKLMFALLALGLFAGSCQMTEVRNDVIGTENTFAAEIENFGGQTKTSMTPELDVVWSEGDQLTIFRGNYLGDRYQIADQYAGKPYGEFQLIAEEAEDDSFSSGTELPANVAIYPYKEGLTLSKNVDGGNVSYTIEGVEFPSEQEYSENSFGEESFIMTAVTESLSDHKLKFKNVGGALKLQLKGTGTIKTVSIQGNNSESLSGTADVTVSTASTPVYEFTSASKEVTLDCGTNGVSLKSSVATNFIISLPAVNFTKGFTVTITDINGKTEELKTTAANNIARSAIHKMPEKTVVFEDEDSGVPQMYIGYIPYETLTANGLYDASGYGNLTEDIINLGVANGEITKSDAKTVTADYTSFGNVPQNAFSIIILPQSSGLTATQWNIIEDCVPFGVKPYSNGENTMTIAGETYLVFGERAKYAWVVGNNEVYYKIKKDPFQSQTLPMYWGHIPTDLAVEYGIVASNGFFDNLKQDCIDACIQSNTIEEVKDPSTMIGEHSFGAVTKPALLIVLLPSESTLTSYYWNSLQGDTKYFDVTGTGRTDNVSNGDKTIIIDGEEYKLYGMVININLTESDSMYFSIRNI